MSTVTDATIVSIDHPTHSAEPDRINGRVTATQVLIAVLGAVGALGAWQQPGTPHPLRIGEAIVIVTVCGLVAFWRPGGRSLVTWGRLALLYRTSPRLFGWGRVAPVVPALADAPALPRPPHLAGRQGVPAPAPRSSSRTAAARPAPSRQKARYLVTQERPYVPIAIDDDMVTFADGRRCATLELSSARNPAFLDGEAQRTLHAAYHGFVRGLTFPIKILHIVTPADLDAYADRRQERARRLPPALQRLELANIDYLRRSARRLGLLDHRSLLVISTDPPTSATTARPFTRVRQAGAAAVPVTRDEEDRAERLLAQRCAAVIAALAPAGIHAWRLDTAALYMLWRRQLCPRSAATQPTPLDNTGDPLAAQVVYDGMDEEDSDRGALDTVLAGDDLDALGSDDEEDE